MCRIANFEDKASPSEVTSLTVAKEYFEAMEKNKKVIIVLKKPSGGRGGSGGNTQDIGVYRDEAQDPITEKNYFEGGEVTNMDVYTPESKTKLDSVKSFVEKKLSDQTKIVILDVAKVKDAAASAIDKKIGTIANGKIIIHKNGKERRVVTPQGRGTKKALIENF